MASFAIVTNKPEDFSKIKEKVIEKGFIYEENSPDFILSYGGDGTLLISEQKFPGIPKLLVRNSEICRQCDTDKLDLALELYKSSKYTIENVKKLEINIPNQKMYKKLQGLNDIVIRNDLPTEALRFSAFVNSQKIGDFIGDGVIIATPYGSGAYFYSVARKKFQNGIGLAFNNTTTHIDPLILDNKDKIKIVVNRGPGIVLADNNREFIKIEKGKEIEIALSEENAKIIRLLLK